MQLSSSRLLTATFAALLTAGIAFAQSQDSSGQSGSGSQSGSQGSTQDPASQPNINTPSTQQPAPPPQEKSAKKEPGSSAPINSPDTVNPKNSKEDVEAIGNRNVGKGINFYSIEKEIGLGKQLAQEVERSAKLVDDPVVTEYVNRVGQNLVRNSDARVPFTIKVIDSDEVNAFALPGGFFYVNSGLILRAQEESELAGVMAHEIAHVAARHGTKQATKGDIAQIASIPAMIFIPYSWAGYAMYQGLNFAIPMTFLKFSRDAEREADFLGLQYMYKAGYDPQALTAFFEKAKALEKRPQNAVVKAFQTHPQTPDRIEKTQKEISTLLPPQTQYKVDTSEFEDVKAKLNHIENRLRIGKPHSGGPTLRRVPHTESE